MSNPASKIIHDIASTGALWVLDSEGVGLDRPIPETLLTLAKQYKTDIRRELETQQSAIKSDAMEKLTYAAQGLPVTVEELAGYFRDDLPDISNMPQAEVNQLSRWYAYTHLGRCDPIPELSPKDSGMVRCSDCQQSRCKYNVDTYTRQTSPRFRWCENYTAKRQGNVIYMGAHDDQITHS